MKKIIILAIVILVGTLAFTAINFYITTFHQEYLYLRSEDVPKTQAALILGSKVYSDGSLSDILRDRTIMAIELYRYGKVDKILVSGDHGTEQYDEVNAVKEYLLAEGIPEEDIFLDHAGFDTYDSMYRAKEIFGVDSVTAVTQEFHLYRAIYIGRSLGMETYGLIADRQPYLNADYFWRREKLARVKAFADVLIGAEPKFLGAQIPITGDGRISWD